MSAEAPRHYPSDLTGSQRAVFDRLLPQPKSGPGKPGRPALERGRVLNAILYVVKTGCQWRQLPQEFGLWQTVYGSFNRWSRQGGLAPGDGGVDGPGAGAPGASPGADGREHRQPKRQDGHPKYGGGV